MNFGYGPEHADPENENVFWEYVRSPDWDESPTTIHAELERRGWMPPDPESVSDQELPTALERLVLDLSWIHVYLHGTDHQPDRELYEELMEHVKYNQIGLWPNDPESAISISFICDGSEEEHELYLRFYADEGERRWWADREPDYRLPPAELPPFPRPWVPTRPLFD
jgi:hypothetical protein